MVNDLEERPIIPIFEEDLGTGIASVEDVVSGVTPSGTPGESTLEEPDGRCRMKECPNCQLVSPDTAQVCDCGYTFQTGGTICPNCQSAEGLEVVGLADKGGRMAAGLLGGAAAKQLLYGSPADEIHCKQCGYRFKVPRRRNLSLLGLGLFLVVAFVVAVIVLIANG
jgi:hypothetical protein